MTCWRYALLACKGWRESLWQLVRTKFFWMIVVAIILAAVFRIPHPAVVVFLFDVELVLATASFALFYARHLPQELRLALGRGRERRLPFHASPHSSDKDRDHPAA